MQVLAFLYYYAVIFIDISRVLSLKSWLEHCAMQLCHAGVSIFLCNYTKGYTGNLQSRHRQNAWLMPGNCQTTMRQTLYANQEFAVLRVPIDC